MKIEVNIFWIQLLNMSNSSTVINTVNFKTKSFGNFDTTKSYGIPKTSLRSHHSKRLHYSHENDNLFPSN